MSDRDTADSDVTHYISCALIVVGKTDLYCHQTPKFNRDQLIIVAKENVQLTVSITGFNSNETILILVVKGNI